MARLTAGQRRKIPSSKFAGPGRSFPVEDAAHAKAAIALSRYAPDPGKVVAAAKAALARFKGK